MNKSICFLVVILSAILVKTSMAADPCFEGMTEAKWKKCEECAKKLNPDYEAKQKKWISCFSEVNKVPADKVPTKFEEIKAVACSDANKANKEKFEQCFNGGVKTEMSAEMKVS
ncbi:hypothetical protein HDE_01146 [Halotydeus destructor]|nr:hypothetical protein HDE_01146 [Halotydeus destructor]